jgi:Acyl-CoA thioesterase C-terminal domain/Acyl-CoA thioesterase N-terminal domain
VTVDLRTFSAASHIREEDPGRFAGELDPEWTIAGKPNGGYLLSMMAQAAGSGAHPHPIAASAHYVRSPDPGLVTIETELLRAGRSASQVRAGMIQDGRLCVEAILTMSRLASTTPFWTAGAPDMFETPYEECPRLIPQLPNGMRVAIMDHVEVRLDPATSGFTSGRPSGRGRLDGWLRLPGGEPFDPLSLLYAVDAFPPATFDIEFSGWVPTLELTVYVRARPAPGPVRVSQRAQLVDAGRVDEACFVWDHTGRLVAQGTQLAGVRLG